MTLSAMQVIRLAKPEHSSVVYIIIVNQSYGI